MIVQFGFVSASVQRRVFRDSFRFVQPRFSPVQSQLSGIREGPVNPKAMQKASTQGYLKAVNVMARNEDPEDRVR